MTLEQMAREAEISKGGLIKGLMNLYLERFTKDFNTSAEKESDAAWRWTSHISKPLLPITAHAVDEFRRPLAGRVVGLICTG